MTRYLVLAIVLLCTASCFTFSPPELPKLPTQPTTPDSPQGPAGFDWQTAIAYAASIIAGVIGFIRWMTVEFKHRALIKQGKKDDNRDGEEDKV